MKLELKENMYVRTKNGIIDKVIIDYKGKCNRPNCNCKHVSCQYNYYDKVDIIKASHNIIDLIEVGDFVNGHEVKSKQSGVKRIDIGEDENYVWLYEEDIKSVITHEQFEQMAYKVGE